MRGKINPANDKATQARGLCLDYGPRLTLDRGAMIRLHLLVSIGGVTASEKHVDQDIHVNITPLILRGVLSWSKHYRNNLI